MRRSSLLALSVIRTMASSLVLSNRRELLACLTQQQLRCRALPGMRQIDTGPRTHVHVDLAILAHCLAPRAEDPLEQWPLGSRRCLFDRVQAHPQVFGSELLRDQVAGREQRVPIPLLVDVVLRHAPTVTARRDCRGIDGFTSSSDLCSPWAAWAPSWSCCRLSWTCSQSPSGNYEASSVSATSASASSRL